MASELRPTVVFKFVLNGPGVVIVVCSLGYHSSCVVVRNFVSVVICVVKISFLWIYEKNGKQNPWRVLFRIQIHSSYEVNF